ncbi:HIRA-interacting protein 3 [Geranomyces michiganensis]|nr:HIRA-interacting protein 3 [Geranomyces michiganensis]
MRESIKTAALETLRAGDLQTLTERSVRRGAEARLGLPEKFLDEPEHKTFIKSLVDAFVDDPAQFAQPLSLPLSVAPATAASSPSPRRKRGDGAVDEAGEDEDGNLSTGRNKRPPGRRVVVDSDDDDKGADSSDDGLERKAETSFETADSRSSSPAPLGEATSDRENIETETRPSKTPPPKAKAKRKSENTTKGSKSIKVSEKDQATITKLKKYIKLCGVNKRLDKEMVDMSGKESIQHLKQMLVDLGVKDNPTIEKCKKVQAKRALQAEVQELDPSMIISGKRR